MKASEARAKAAGIRVHRRLQNKARAAKAKVTSIKREQERRANFLKSFSDYADESIMEAVKEGKKFTDISMWPSGNTYVAGEAQLEEHGYKDLIKKIERRLKKDGYKVTHRVETNEHTTMHESSVPDYTYYSYHAYVRISW